MGFTGKNEESEVILKCMGYMMTTIDNSCVIIMYNA